MFFVIYSRINQQWWICFGDRKKDASTWSILFKHQNLSVVQDQLDKWETK